MSVTREEIEDYYKSFRPALLKNLKFTFLLVGHIGRSADDIVQDVFMTLINRADEITFESKQHAFNWLNQRARRDAKSHFRVGLSRWATIEREQHMTPGQLCIMGRGPDSPQHTAYLAGEVLSHAAPADRATVYAAFCEGVTLRELAAELGVTYETVRLRLNRFRAQVPDALLKGEQRLRRDDPARHKKLIEDRYAQKRKRYAKRVGGLKRKKRKGVER